MTVIFLLFILESEDSVSEVGVTAATQGKVSSSGDGDLGPTKSNCMVGRRCSTLTCC